MTDRVTSAEKIVEGFSPDELTRFATWFANFQDSLWEKQIERDSNSGRLDALIDKAHRDFDTGHVREL